MKAGDWAEPPARQKGRPTTHLTPSVVKKLKTRPGAWLYLGFISRATVNRISENYYDGMVEVVGRRCRADGRSDVYVRWVE